MHRETLFNFEILLGMSMEAKKGYLIPAVIYYYSTGVEEDYKSSQAVEFKFRKKRKN